MFPKAGGSGAILIALATLRLPVIRSVRILPEPKAEAVTPFCAEEAAPRY